MFFFAVNSVTLDFMASGTIFQILTESLKKVEFRILHPNVSFSMLSFDALVRGAQSLRVHICATKYGQLITTCTCTNFSQ